VHPWRAAATLRDRIESAAKSNGHLMACGAVAIRGLPDSESGAYLFRNGAREAFAQELGINMTDSGNAEGQCSFRWNGNEFTQNLSGSD
jgi:hypothetical protein